MTKLLHPLGIRRIILRIEKTWPVGDRHEDKDVNEIRDAIMNGDTKLAEQYGIDPARVPAPYHPDATLPTLLASKPDDLLAELVALRDEVNARLDRAIELARQRRQS